MARKKKDQLNRIGSGFYSDSAGVLYVDVVELLTTYGEPTTEEACNQAWEEIHRSFGPTEIIDISD